MSELSRFSRRALLSAAASSIALVAGCTGNADSSSSSTTPSDESVFRTVTCEGSDVVVHLKSGHDVTRLNLIAPDGSLFDGTTIATGATTIQMPILDIKPAGGRYDHYVPGRYEIVAVREDQSETRMLELQPELQITEIRQYQAGERANDLGKIAVTVENVGSGPTWVYDITYRGAPNTGANDALSANPGIKGVTIPEQANQLILSPGEHQTYVGTTRPLLFTDQEKQQCHGNSALTVIVGTAVGEPLKQRITMTVSGEVQSAGLIGEYVCTEIGIQMAPTGVGSNGSSEEDVA